MPASQAVVAFVPREVFSTTRHALETLLQRTTEPFDLIVVDGGSPPPVANYLRQASRVHGFTLLRTEQYLTPNQSRNLAARWARDNSDAPYVVFVDNDALVAPGWLSAMVACAEETGAWVVGPAYFEHLPEGQTLHMFGGQCRIETNANGSRSYVEKHNYAHKPIDQLTEPLVRCETELIEFHTVLVRQQALETIGMLDEGFLCHAEHGDLCLSVRQAGGTVWLEPLAQVTYVPPRRLEHADREFFFLRWSEAWLAANQHHMQKKWGVDLAAQNAPGRGVHWVRGHRRYGLAFLARLRGLLGRKLTRSIEKRCVMPFEPMINRRRYPPEEYGQSAVPEVTVVNNALQHRRAAA